jgi:hypothetical protein
MLTALIVLFLTGCANHNLLIRCQQLEGQRDTAQAKAVELAQENVTLKMMIIQLYAEYMKIKPKQLSN